MGSFCRSNVATPSKCDWFRHSISVFHSNAASFVLNSLYFRLKMADYDPADTECGVDSGVTTCPNTAECNYCYTCGQHCTC